MKQLVEVLWCDLQVTINEGLMEIQMEVLKTIGSFVDHLQSEMTTLSPSQMHSLLDHLWTRHGGSQALLDAIRRGETSTQPESFLQNGPSQLLQDFFDSLPNHQIDIQKDSTALSHLEIKVDNTAITLQTRLTEVCSNSALMLNFKPSMQGITTINLTQEEAIIKFPPLKENIAPS